MIQVHNISVYLPQFTKTFWIHFFFIFAFFFEEIDVKLADITMMAMMMLTVTSDTVSFILKHPRR